MSSNVVFVVFAAVVILTTKSFGAVRLPTKGSTGLPTEITAVKSGAAPTNLSGHGSSASGQSREAPYEDSKGPADNGHAIDRKDTAATYNSPTYVQRFGNGNAHDVYSTFHGYHPLFLNSRGFSIADSPLQFVLATSFPYLAAPYLYVGPCSLECEYFAFPLFHHGTGSTPLHDLAEYHRPHHNTPGFQPNRFPYAATGYHNRPGEDSVQQSTGGHVTYPADRRDVSHIKTPPRLLQSRINSQYAS